MKTYLKKTFFSVTAIFVALSALFFTSVPQAHAQSTFVWNNHGNYVPMYYAPTSAYNNVKLWIPNGTRFAMSCWTDFQWYTGNYTTNRWFWGQEYSRGTWGYVNASYVWYQTSVPHC